MNMAAGGTSTLGRAPGETTAGEARWSLWRRQVEGILRLEFRKTLRGGRIIPLLLLAALPVGLLVLFSIAPLPTETRETVNPVTVFASVYLGYYLPIGIFLGCLVTFIQLFRGDVLDRSLHYYLLCPIRREVLVAAKYLTGLLITSSVLVVSTSASCLILHLSFGDSLLGGGVLTQLLQYSGITFLGCLGYGAVFMLAGLFFRNPVVPAVSLFVWELINPFLGPLLKKISVIHYLLSLLPVPVSSKALQVLSPSISPWLAIPGLILVTAAAVFLAGLRLRRTEITYSDD